MLVEEGQIEFLCGCKEMDGLGKREGSGFVKDVGMRRGREESSSKRKDLDRVKGKKE